MSRLVIVDDHPAFLLGLRALIDRQGDLHLVGEATSASGALRMLRSGFAREPIADVVVLDLDLGRGSAEGLELVRRIEALEQAPAVLALGAHREGKDVLAAIDAGALGFLGKETQLDALLAGIRAAARGETVLDSTAARRVLRRMRSDVPALSRREEEVLHLLSEGLTTRKIASKLYVSESTAKGHLGSIYTKLGVTSRGAAVAAAVRTGLVHLN